MMGRSLIYIGLTLAAIGVIVTLAGKIPFIGRLPGDVLIKRENFTFYFPLATCLLVSLVLMLISRFFGPK